MQGHVYSSYSVWQVSSCGQLRCCCPNTPLHRNGWCKNIHKRSSEASPLHFKKHKSPQLVKSGLAFLVKCKYVVSLVYCSGELKRTCQNSISQCPFHWWSTVLGEGGVSASTEIHHQIFGLSSVDQEGVQLASVHKLLDPFYSSVQNNSSPMWLTRLITVISIFFIATWQTSYQ